MKAMLVVGFATLAVLVSGGAPAAVAGEGRATCPEEVARAGAMVAQARAVMKAAQQGGTQVAGVPPGDPVPGTARAPQEDRAARAARGLATSAASDITPWNPQPTDKTLQARTTKARRLTAQARKFCAAGKTDEAKAKALEAIAVLSR